MKNMAHKEREHLEVMAFLLIFAAILFLVPLLFGCPPEGCPHP